MNASTTPRVAIVTGAGSGIGKAVAQALLHDGWHVVLAGRRAEPLQAVAQASGADPRALAVPTDVNNLTVLAADFNLRPTIPLLSHPDADDADADGQGTGDMLDPHGYLVLQQVDGTARSDQGNLLSQWSVSGADQPVSEPPA